MGTALYSIFIKPIEFLIELVFSIMNIICKNPGFAIVFVSIAVQLLCFPLYKRADAIQEQERQKQKEMKPWLEHIKKTFKGDERFMMQQAYYRIADYKPIYAIKGSVSLLLQIPFFIAAYNFLSNLDLLKGTPFFAITDLSKPDQLIHIGAVSLNLLPILMTVFNIISGIIYTKGFPLKDKIQTYGLACIFLIILYKSPSGLVFYWTLNNLFSLLKNVFMKLVKNPKKVLIVLGVIISVVIIAAEMVLPNLSVYKRALYFGIAVIGAIPAVISLIHKKRIQACKKEYKVKPVSKAEKTVFYFGIIALTVLLGMMIPFSVISTSPTEFDQTNNTVFGLLFQILCNFIGIILVWINIFYSFSNDRFKRILTYSVSVLLACGLVTYMFFGRNLGTMSPMFYFYKTPEFSVNHKVVNFLIVIAVSFIIIFLTIKKPLLTKSVFQIMIVTMLISSTFSGVKIAKALSDEWYKKSIEQAEDYEQIIPISKNGKNVVVIMLDRAISGYVPYLLSEKPELKTIYDGFTYYPNAISFGGSTNYGTPALFGGYEYTPTEMNKRSEETLEKKHNEALLMMPVLFSNEGYKVTVLDPPYAGYQTPSSLSIYDKYSGINAYFTEQRYINKTEFDSAVYDVNDRKQKHNFLCYSFMKIVPVIFQNIVYDGGNYYSTSSEKIVYEKSFWGCYAVLQGLNQMTDIKNDSSNTFLLMQNSITHEPFLLQKPDYLPSHDSIEFTVHKKSDDNKNTITVSETVQESHYDVNMAALLKIGEWLNYLRKNDVYDNTRIIIVSDHGRQLNQFENIMIDDDKSIEFCRAFLMIKDFDSTGFNVSDEFMTNADTPTYAVKDIVNNPKNPFTDNPINNDEKYLHPQLITTSSIWAVTKNNGNIFDTSDGEWWSVHDNIFDEKNWKKVEVN